MPRSQSGLGFAATAELSPAAVTSIPPGPRYGLVVRLPRGGHSGGVSGQRSVAATRRGHATRWAFRASRRTRTSPWSTIVVGDVLATPSRPPARAAERSGGPPDATRPEPRERARQPDRARPALAAARRPAARRRLRRRAHAPGRAGPAPRPGRGGHRDLGADVEARAEPLPAGARLRPPRGQGGQRLLHTLCRRVLHPGDRGEHAPLLARARPRPERGPARAEAGRPVRRHPPAEGVPRPHPLHEPRLHGVRGPRAGRAAGPGRFRRDPGRAAGGPADGNAGGLADRAADGFGGQRVGSGRVARALLVLALGASVAAAQGWGARWRRRREARREAAAAAATQTSLVSRVTVIKPA